MGAPKGSRLIWNDGANELEFGTLEGLAVYLNGTDLPDAVYEQSDARFVYEEFGRLVGSEGRVVSHWQGPRETASTSTAGPSRRCSHESARSSTPTRSARKRGPLRLRKVCDGQGRSGLGFRGKVCCKLCWGPDRELWYLGDRCRRGLGMQRRDVRT